MAVPLQPILNHLNTITPHGVVADSILATLLSVGLLGIANPATYLQAGTFGMTESSAKLLLEKLASIIHKVHDTADPAFQQPYKKPLASAETIIGFAKDHPVFCLVVALGVLPIIFPYGVQSLGFKHDGPALGKRD